MSLGGFDKGWLVVFLGKFEPRRIVSKGFKYCLL